MDATVKRIAEEAATIKATISRMKIFDTPVDMDSINCMIVAAYHLGMSTARAMQKKQDEQKEKGES